MTVARFGPYHAPAMANPLLDRALPEELADRRQVFELKGKIEDFPRLVEIVEADLEMQRPRRSAPARLAGCSGKH